MYIYPPPGRQAPEECHNAPDGSGTVWNWVLVLFLGARTQDFRVACMACTSFLALFLASLFQSLFYNFFDRFWIDFASQNGPKTLQKSMPKSVDFSMPFWIDFWIDLGSQNPPKIDQKSIPKSMKSRSPYQRGNILKMRTALQRELNFEGVGDAKSKKNY